VDVQFDYGGALALAATLWSLADDVEALASTRERTSASASEEWEGSYGAQFDVASVDAVSRARSVATSLRSDAEAWAQAWAKAMDDQNDITYEREYDRVWRAHEAEREQNFLASLFPMNLPRRPDSVAVPAAPSFAPTAVLVSY
jgi:hypothetical protein